MADDYQSSNAASARGPSTTTRRPDPLIGTVLADRYRILEVLGRGGMGVVYKARHEFMDRNVALKMLLPQLVADDKSMDRFRIEAQAASRINHPNIIGLHDFGFTPDGLPYLVMDYLDGHSLADLIKRDGQLGVQRTVTIFLQICDAVDHAHRQGVIHRDLKPGNIMLIQHQDDANFVKVVDFGVAKMYNPDGVDAQRLTTTGEIFGSPVYMSPEQCAGDRLDARSDVYSLGCVLYETLTGKLPLVGKNAIETIAKHMQVVPEPFATARPDLYIPDWLESIVFRALAKDPTHRHQTMIELHDELMLGFTSTCSSSQLQALPPRVIGGSMSSMKLRTIDAQRSLTGTVPRVESKDGPSTRTRVFFLAIFSVLLLGGGALAFNFIKPPQGPSLQRVEDSVETKDTQSPADEDCVNPDEKTNPDKQNSEKTSGTTGEKPQTTNVAKPVSAEKTIPADNIPPKSATTTKPLAERKGNPGSSSVKQPDKKSATSLKHAIGDVSGDRAVVRKPHHAASVNIGAPVAIPACGHRRHHDSADVYYDYAAKHEHGGGQSVSFPTTN